jgi:phosphoglycolate phosphatase-like HAD superfamily hydrolase
MSGRADRTGQLLIFDLDGTLYCTESSFAPTMQAVYAEYGIPYPSDEAVLGEVGEPFSVFLDWMIEQGFPNDRESLAERITELELVAIAENGRLFPEVQATLRALRDAGHLIALCTNGDRRYAETVLSSCRILDLFDELQTNEVDGTTKTELVRDLLARIPHNRAFMIGDRYHDIEAGRANGCTVVGAAYGYGNDEELSAADLRIDRFADLLTAIA